MTATYKKETKKEKKRRREKLGRDSPYIFGFMGRERKIKNAEMHLSKL